jgi:hypothetical protein
MPLLHQIVALLIPVVAIWPLTSLLVRFNRYTGRRVSPQAACFHAGILAFGAGVATWLFLASRAGTLNAGELLGGLAYFFAYCTCCTFLNWFVFAVSDTSMHVHLMVEVGREDGIALNELQRRYNKRIIIQARIPRLLELGQLRLNGDRLVLGGRWVLAGAEAARLMRILLSIPPQPVQEDSPSHGRA